MSNLSAKNERKKREKKIERQAVTNQCGICSDQKSRKSEDLESASAKNILKVSPFKCASMGKLKYNYRKEASTISKVSLKLNKCKVVSDFCAICPDGRYLFTKTGAEIASDAYECATSPRHQKGTL